MYKKLLALLCCICCFLPVTAFASDELVIGGDSIGIEVDYNGVVVTGTYSLTIDGNFYDPGDIFRKGDVIIAVQTTPIKSLDDLYLQINQRQGLVNDIPVTIIRNHIEEFVTLKTVYDESSNSYKSGLYVKDKIVGVGTLTYYDPSHNSYGALGHEIMDSDLKEMADINSGLIFTSKVTSISKAQSNVAGEKHAEINFNQDIGNILKNTKLGIFGEFYGTSDNVLKLPWAKKEEVVTGPAQIYTVLQGKTIESFEIEITKLHEQSESQIKGIEFVVSDPTLLERTNGIVQGMSGSPIIQNGKIIGAITHVVTSDPVSGYGIYIQWMLAESSSLS